MADPLGADERTAIRMRHGILHPCLRGNREDAIYEIGDKCDAIRALDALDALTAAPPSDPAAPLDECDHPWKPFCKDCIPHSAAELEGVTCDNDTPVGPCVKWAGHHDPCNARWYGVLAPPSDPAAPLRDALTEAIEWAESTGCGCTFCWEHRERWRAALQEPTP